MSNPFRPFAPILRTVTRETLAQDLAEFEKRGGKIEVLDNTPTRPMLQKQKLRGVAYGNQQKRKKALGEEEE